MTQQYVLGFAINLKLNKVVMIRKTKPDWAKGKLNGVGGKVEEFDLNHYAAMTREFHEETGVHIDEGSWYYMTHFGSPEREDNPFNVDCFVTLISEWDIKAVRTTTEETVEVWDMDRVFKDGKCVPHMGHLLPEAYNLARELQKKERPSIWSAFINFCLRR